MIEFGLDDFVNCVVGEGDVGLVVLCWEIVLDEV